MGGGGWVVQGAFYGFFSQLLSMSSHINIYKLAVKRNLSLGLRLGLKINYSQY